MDDDPVLQELGADLERDDPALAALLCGAAPPSHHPRIRLVVVVVLLLVPALLFPALLLPARITLGLLAVLLILSSPVLVAWLCMGNPEPPDAPG